PGFGDVLLETIAAQRALPGSGGELQGCSLPGALARLRGEPEDPLSSSVCRAEQSNTSLIYGNRLILKLFRRIEEGLNPDLEITRLQAERAGFAHTPAVAGWLEYRTHQGEPRTVGCLHGLVSDARTA